MSADSDDQRAFAGAMLQSAGSDFLASFSELLHAASLIERRPRIRADNPDIDGSLKRARWFLVGSLEALARADGDRKASGGGAAPQPNVPARASQAVAQGILVECQPAVGFVGEVIAGQNRGRVTPVFTTELLACAKALERLDAESTNFTVQLHMALSAYAGAMIKGQYVAYLNRST